MSQDSDSIPALEFSLSLPPERTNTLIITGLPKPFFNPPVVDALRSCFGVYGPVHTWSVLKSFSRMIVVYYDEEDAELAKKAYDDCQITASNDWPSARLRVWRADPTCLEHDSEHRLLKPPEIEKNFLISPPGSPPVGWEQIREEPPNSTPLADDLISALRKLEIQAEFQRSKVKGRPGVEVLIDPEEEHGIAVYVEDCDRIDEDDMDVYENDDEYGNGEGWAYSDARYRIGGLPAGWRPAPTAMPPMPIHI